MQKLLLFLTLTLLTLPVRAEPQVVLHKPPAAQCAVLIASLKQQLIIGNYCNKDGDCTTVDLGCPLPCRAPINAHEDVARMKALKESYDHVCEPCTSACPPEHGEPACVEHKCVAQ